MSSFNLNQIDQEKTKELQKNLIELIAKDLSPIAFKYAYSSTSLESQVKWKPLVLILGNYSSGKSTLINELLGFSAQKTGQAPTEDCFTVITGEDKEEGHSDDMVEERDGHLLLSDPTYPFEALSRHGKTFISRFRYKKVSSPWLKNFALIDTPGMLDSLSEKERGYDYQAVIGDLVELADLVLVLFDAHKAGTVRESHLSVRHTLPEKAFEERVIYVLNRIDECQNLEDLIRVYGTLCWNLSQMTGYKDIPKILLSYSSKAEKSAEEIKDFADSSSFLPLLENQRQELKKVIFKTPLYRLDNLSRFAELHAVRLLHLVEALQTFKQRLSGLRLRWSLIGLLVSLLFGGVFVSYLGFVKLWKWDLDCTLTVGAILIFYLTWSFIVYLPMSYLFRKKVLSHLSTLMTEDNQSKKEHWDAVEKMVAEIISKRLSILSRRDLNREVKKLREFLSKENSRIKAEVHKLNSLFKQETD